MIGQCQRKCCSFSSPPPSPPLVFRPLSFVGNDIYKLYIYIYIYIYIIGESGLVG